jgi:integrase
VKQQLAAVHMLFDWLITGQVVPFNPASTVRGPKHVVKTGTTPVLDAPEWRKLSDAIPTETVRDLRDRALIATLTNSFARIGAALKMKVEDLRPKGAGWVLRLHEKGGKQHTMPCHYALADALRSYSAAAAPGFTGSSNEPKRRSRRPRPTCDPGVSTRGSHPSPDCPRRRSGIASCPATVSERFGPLGTRCTSATWWRRLSWRPSASHRTGS